MLPRLAVEKTGIQLRHAGVNGYSDYRKQKNWADDSDGKVLFLYNHETPDIYTLDTRLFKLYVHCLETDCCFQNYDTFFACTRNYLQPVCSLQTVLKTSLASASTI